jgi:hypothetical protein
MKQTRKPCRMASARLQSCARHPLGAIAGRYHNSQFKTVLLYFPVRTASLHHDSEGFQALLLELHWLNSLQPRAVSFESSRGCLPPISFLYNSYLLSDKSTNFGFQGLCRRSSRAIVTGRSKRRGPALPGFT